MPTKAEKRALGRTSATVLRPLTELLLSEFVVVTSCALCDFGERTTGHGSASTGNAAPPLVVRSAINAIRKHVALSGHEVAHVKIIETRAYAPRAGMGTHRGTAP